MSKVAKLHFKTLAEYEAAKIELERRQVFILTIDANKFDPSLFPNANISYEDVELSDKEKRKLMLWLRENDSGDDFLESLAAGLRRYGRLTPKQYSVLKDKFTRVEGEEP